MLHIHERYDFVANAFIVFEGKVLLVNHPRYDKWLPVGGHVELDEDPDSALIREVEEEVGLEIEILNPKPKIKSPGTKFLFTPNYLDVHDANPPHRHIALNYFVKASNGEAVKSDEHTEIKWFTPAELSNPKYKISNAIKFLAEEAIKFVEIT